MIITKLENLEQYYGICSALRKIPVYLQNNPNPAVGKYDLDDGDYVNVIEYDTKENDGKYEAHKKYLDVQIMLNGEEIVYVQELTNSMAKSEYDEEKDVQFFSATEKQTIVLKEGVAGIFLPHDAHRPSIKLGEIKQVKKAVFKIIMSKEENHEKI